MIKLLLNPIRIFLTTLLLASASSYGQTTLYTENFNGSSSSFTMNTTDVGSTTSGHNAWLINNTYNGGGFGYVCLGNATFMLASATSQQPTGIIGNPTSNYMHICSNNGVSAGITNNNLLPCDSQCVFLEKYFAKMTSDISTVGFTGVNFKFWYQAIGSPDNYGKVYYSTDGGATWTDIGTHFNNQSLWIQNTISNAAFDNQATLRFGFMFYNDRIRSGAGTNPFGIDDIIITGIPAVTSRPVPGFSVSDTAGCQHSCFTFTDTSSNYPTSRVWYFPGGNPSTATTSPVTVCYDSARTYSAKLVVTNGIGTDSITKSTALVIHPRPVTTITRVVDTLFATSTGTSFQWTLYNNPVGGATSSKYHPFTAGQYRVIATNAFGCHDTSVVFPYVLRPAAAILISDTAGCAGKCVTYTDNSAGAPTYRVWTFPGGTPSSASTSSVTVCYTTAGVYNAKLVVTNAGGTDSTTRSNIINIHARPAASISQVGDSLIAVPAGTYSWILGTAIVAGATGRVLHPTVSGSYRVIVTNAFGCFDTSAVFIYNMAQLHAQYTESDSVVCLGSCLTFTDNSTGGTVQARRWTFTGANVSSATTSPVTVCYLTLGYYSVSLRVTGASGSDSVTHTNSIHVIAPPAGSISVSGNTLTATPVGAASYTWLNPLGTVISGATGQTYSPATSGLYKVIIRDTHGCQDTVGFNFTRNGINDIHSDMFSIYPNPFENLIQIDMSVAVDVAEVNIYSVDGKLMGHHQISGHSSTINTSDLSQGLYVVKIKNHLAEYTYKMVKQN